MDWLSYSPADLVPFSQATWRGVMAGYNRDHFPLVAAGMALGLLLLWLTARPSGWRLRLSLGVLGACWLWIAWGFFHHALGTLLWAADWLAWGFAAQGALLLLATLLPARPAVSPRWSVSPAWWLLLFAVLALPLIALAAGRPANVLGWVGTAPDPTVIATLALAAMVPGRRGWLLLPVPLLWCAASATMLAVFGDPLWWLPLAAVPIAAIGFARQKLGDGI